MSTASPTTNTTREPVVVTMSILAGLAFLFGGWAGVTALNGNATLAGIGAVGVLAVAAAQVGLQFYVRGQVTPAENAVDQSTARPPSVVNITTPVLTVPAGTFETLGSGEDEALDGGDEHPAGTSSRPSDL